MKMYLLNILFLILFYSCNCYSFDKNIADISVWASAAAYCNKEKYYDMLLSGPAKGFQVHDIIYDKKSDMQGYLGIMLKKKQIYVVLRGSHSPLNWLFDFEIKHTDYISYPECDCDVHTGFYSISNDIKNVTITQLQLLQNMYPSFSIILTGHSLAASVIELLSMELFLHDIDHQNYNFGKPRVGDKQFAEFVNTKITPFRFTHYKDIVPHLVPESANYFHSCREIYENKHGKLKECSITDCEDPTCAEQFDLVETNTKDHLRYLNHDMSCEASVSNYKKLDF